MKKFLSIFLGIMIIFNMGVAFADYDDYEVEYPRVVFENNTNTESKSRRLF